MGVHVRLHNGDWYVFIYKDNSRKTRKVGPGESGKRLATELADRIRTRLAFGEALEVKRQIPEFAAYAELWLKSVSALKKTGTYETYERHMRSVWLPALGQHRLDKITRTHIKTTLISLQQKYKYSRPYMLSILTAVQSCLAEAVDEEIISQNVANRQTKNISKTELKEIEVFTEPELKLLIKTAIEYSMDMYVKVLIMARTGMREGEMLALKVEDLNFDKDHIWVRRTWGSRNAKKNLSCINLPKSGKWRFVDMSPQLKNVLQDYLQRTRLPSSWLFPGASTDRLPFTPNGFSWHWQRLLEKAGLQHRGPHALRHTWATLLLAQGENIVFIKEQLGHSSVKITLDVYAHVLPRTGASGSTRLDDQDWESLTPNERLKPHPNLTKSLRLISNT